MFDVEARCHIFTCRYCGQTYRTRIGLKRYCSDQCYIKAHPRRPHRHPRWTHQEDRLVRQLAGKMPAKGIAARLGRTREAVQRRACSYLKISLQCYGEGWVSAKHSDAVVEQARTLRDEGVGPTAIAARLNIPLSTVEKYVYYSKRLGPPIEYYF